jgi:tetratricopeptide (TPR) repeat protein
MRGAGIVIVSLVLLAVGLYMFYIQVQDFAKPQVYDADKEIVPDNLPADLAIEVEPEKPEQLEVEAIPVSQFNTPPADDELGEDDDPSGEQLKAWDKKMGRLCVKLVKQKKLSKALDCLMLQLAQNPDNPEVNLNLGIVAAMQGDATEAYHRYVRYLELDPDGVRAPQVQRVLDQYDARQMEDDRERTPEESKALKAGLDKYQAAYQLKDSDPQQALRQMKEALALVPPTTTSLRKIIQQHIDELEEKINGPSSVTTKSDHGDSLETLNKRQIAEKLMQYLKAMKGCADQQRKRDPSVKGIMWVSFMITGSGKTKDVRILTKEHKGTYAAGCISFIIKNLEFPKFSGEPIEVPRLPIKLGD